jgi:hypothetical protein
MGELAAKAREGKLGVAEMQGGCISISSLGGKCAAGEAVNDLPVYLACTVGVALAFVFASSEVHGLRVFGIHRGIKAGLFLLTALFGFDGGQAGLLGFTCLLAGLLLGSRRLPSCQQCFLVSAAFNARVIPSVAYTDPEVAWVGLTEDQAKAQGIKVKKGLFPWSASGRAIANGRDEGYTKLLFDDSPEAGSGDGHAGRGHGKILGGGMVGTHAGDMIGEIALAIEMGADAVDIGKTIHPHPTLGESIGMAAEVAHGSCTDVPPARK